MLFNSFEFILCFLPLTLGAYFACRAGGWLRGSVAVLAIASVAFYAWWDWRNLFILGGSIVFNFMVGRRTAERDARARAWLVAGIAGNLLLLVFFKYWDFFAVNVSSATGREVGLLKLALPLGISFFTFTQIAFLLDTWRGKAREYRFLQYVLFVSYFPHLIAGPIIHHGQFMPQLSRRFGWAKIADDFGLGLLVFTLGLAKKVLLADNIAPHANAAFQAAADGRALDPTTAWTGVLAYTLQLYFDFSGYSDMAVGLSKMLGINLPINFNAPYRATSMIDFWRRWHMSLSRFLRDYLYIPLGGNRHGPARRYVNLLATMVLGGFWHGAGWTFIIWGAIHGVALSLNHLWRTSGPRAWLRVPGPLRAIIGWALTFSVAIFGWVYFRAHDVPSAHRLFAAMAGLTWAAIWELLGAAQVSFATVWALGWRDCLLATLGLAATMPPAHGLTSQMQFLLGLPWLLALSVGGPTALSLACLVRRDVGARAFLVRTRGVVLVTAIAVLFFACLGKLNHATEFLYFQF